MLKKMAIYSLGLIGVSLVSSSVAFAATATIIHGIDGRDLKLAQSLPVDISVNGACALKGVTYKSKAITDLPAGTYTIAVSSSDGKCSLSPLFTKKVTVSARVKSIALIANLSEKGVPQLSAFNTDLSSVGRSSKKSKKDVYECSGVIHSAYAPAVRVSIATTPPGPRLKAVTLRNGSKVSATCVNVKRSGASVTSTYTVKAKSGGAALATFKIETAAKTAQTALLKAIVGSVSSGLELIDLQGSNL